MMIGGGGQLISGQPTDLKSFMMDGMVLIEC